MAHVSLFFLTLIFLVHSHHCQAFSEPTDRVWNKNDTLSQSVKKSSKFAIKSVLNPIPSGVIYDQSIAELLTDGFVVCYDETYATPTTATILRAACHTNSDSLLFVGAKSSSGALTAELGAFGMADAVLAPSFSDRQAVAHNGLYWYLFNTDGFGFTCGSASILLGSGTDYSYGDCQLNWMMDGMQGGYRAGWVKGLDNDVTWRKVVYVYNGPIPNKPAVTKPKGFSGSFYFKTTLTLTGPVSSGSHLNNVALAVVVQSMADVMETSVSNVVVINQRMTWVRSNIYKFHLDIQVSANVGKKGNGVEMYNLLRNKLEAAVTGGSFPVTMVSVQPSIEDSQQSAVSHDLSVLAARLDTIDYPTHSSGSSSHSSSGGTESLSQWNTIYVVMAVVPFVIIVTCIGIQCYVRHKVVQSGGVVVTTWGRRGYGYRGGVHGMGGNAGRVSVATSNVGGGGGGGVGVQMSHHHQQQQQQTSGVLQSRVMYSAADTHDRNNNYNNNNYSNNYDFAYPSAPYAPYTTTQQYGQPSSSAVVMANVVPVAETV